MISIEKLESHQCRTCYNATKALKLLTTVTKCGGTKQLKQKSYADLLKEVSNINIMEDPCKELPQFICDNCIRKLKTTHAFIQQTQEVNERLMSMLMLSQEETNKQLDCLQESQVDIQSCLEIKMEHEEADAQEELQAQCHVELKLEEPEEFSQDSNLKVDDILSAKKVESVLLLSVNDGNSFKSSESVMENENNEDILKMVLSKENKQSMSNSESNIVLSKNCDNNDDGEFHDIQLEDSEWEDETDNYNSKNNNKKNTEKSRKNGRKFIKVIEDDDVAVPCSQCNKIFSNSKALARHQRTSHIPEEQKCTCPLCFRKFSRSCNMYTHMRTFHGPDTVPLIRKPSTQERIYQCDKCTRNYTKKKHLNIHIKNKHSDESDNDKKSSNSIERVKDSEDVTSEKNASNLNKPKRYEVRSLCSICGTSFTSKTHLIVHMRRHTGERPFKCDLCDRAYPRISELTCHRRIHTGEKPFACKICGKTFRVSSKMTTHMRSHTNIRPYKCTQCDRSFKYSKDLSIHFRIHTGERPYCCKVCGSTFTQSNTLKAHRMKLGHIESVTQNENNLI